MINDLDYSGRISVHGAVEEDVRSRILDFHTTTNWIRRSHVGFNLSYVRPLDTDTSPRRRELSLALSSSEDYPVQPASVPQAPLRGRSTRRFAHARLPFTHIERLLTASFSPRGQGYAGRPYPSAGALYPVQVLLLLLAEEIVAPDGMSASVYHFRPVASTLTPLACPPRARLMETLVDIGHEATDDESAIVGPAFALAYVLYADGAIVRYRERGYRFGLIEAGAMSHQADLVGGALGLGSCMFGGFGDAEVAAICGLNSGVMLPLAVQFFGPADLNDALR